MKKGKPENWLTLKYTLSLFGVNAENTFSGKKCRILSTVPRKIYPRHCPFKGRFCTVGIDLFPGAGLFKPFFCPFLGRLGPIQVNIFSPFRRFR
jgi:hypothetical protein